MRAKRSTDKFQSYWSDINDDDEEEDEDHASQSNLPEPQVEFENLPLHDPSTRSSNAPDSEYKDNNEDSKDASGRLLANPLILSPNNSLSSPSTSYSESDALEERVEERKILEFLLWRLRGLVLIFLLPTLEKTCNKHCVCEDHLIYI